MPLAANALTSVANAKAYAGISGSTQDTLLELLINSISSNIEKYCGRSFHSAERTEKYDGDGSQRIYLKNFPITTIDTVSIDDIDTGDFDTNDDAGILYREDGFNEGFQNVEVIYTAGYSTIPADLEIACIKLVAKALDRRLNEGASSVSAGGTSISWDGEMDAEVKAILELYKRVKV